MRIIGGTFKGIQIFEAFDKNTRPLKDLVKESILNILEHSKENLFRLLEAKIHLKQLDWEIELFMVPI